MVTAITKVEVSEPHRDEARKGADFLDRAAKTDRAGLFLSKPTGENVVFELPSDVLTALRALLDRIADNAEVLLLNMETELTPEQAAKVLGISRPIVYQRMDSGRLPYRPVGSHRRVLLKDVLALREFENQRRRVAKELSEDTDALETDYAPSPRSSP
jgi:excisionase family DNA binding protein